MTTILIPRPDAEARQTATRLQAKGYETIITPVLDIAPVEARMPDGTFQAVMITSVQAVPWLAKQDGVQKSMPVFAVGLRTAAALRDAGFTDVRSAEGDRTDLAALVRKDLPTGASLLHPVGRDHHGDVPEGLRRDGFRVETPVVYAANFAGSLTEEALAALRYDVADAVMHFSPRSASAFMSLLNRSDIDPASLHLRHICLSQQVAEALPEAVRSQAIVADRPDEGAMVAAAEAIFGATGASTDGRAQRVRKARTRAFPVEAKAEPLAGTNTETPAQRADIAQSATTKPDPVSAPTQQPQLSAAPSLTEPSDLMKKTDTERADSGTANGSPANPEANVRAEAMPPPRQSMDAAEMRAGQAKDADSARPRRIGLPLLAAGLLGGVLGGAAALYVPPYLPKGWIPKAQGPDIAGLVAAQVKSDLDTRLAASPSRADIDSIKQSLANAAAQQSQSAAALQSALTDANRKIGDVEKLARAVPEQVTLAQRQVSELAKRVDLLDGVAKVPYDIVGLSKRIEDLAARRPEPAPDLTPLDKQLAAANAAIADLRAKIDAVATKPVPDTARPVRIHALATGLTGALQRGAPYRAEFDALTQAGVTAASIQPLQPFADKGAPTGAMLAKQFESLAPKILAALQPPAPANPGMWDRVREMTGNMVRVRPVGQNAGETPAGQIARIEAALPRNAFSDALKAWQALPPAGQAAAAEFGQLLKARSEADTAARAFVDEATRALARQGQ